MFTGKKLRLLRIARQIKQEELARKLGISQQHYSALENSEKIPEKRAKDILALLNLTPLKAAKILQLLASEIGN